jgi:hypothetical protein
VTQQSKQQGKSVAWALLFMLANFDGIYSRKANFQEYFPVVLLHDTLEKQNEKLAQYNPLYNT